MRKAAERGESIPKRDLAVAGKDKHCEETTQHQREFDDQLRKLRQEKDANRAYIE